MIFVTLGTQDKPFRRILEKLDELIEKGYISGEVIVQAGSTKYKSKYMRIMGFIDMDKFNKYVSECDYMITHAGVGTIMNGIDQGKKVLAVARRVKHGEHENDHQVEITEKFEKMGYIIGCTEVRDLQEKISLLKNFEVKKYESNNAVFCTLINRMINE